MTGVDLDSLKRWFSEYTSSFFSSSDEDNGNYKLKVEHTHNVCENIRVIAEDESLNDEKAHIAEAVALFHDIGRFPQYSKYRTFNDRLSLNHGQMGAEVLTDEAALKGLSDREGEIILQAVKFHNAFSIPKALDEEIILFLKLIRDADKLDIVRLFIDYYGNVDGDRSSVPAHGLPDNSEYSSDVISCLHNGEIASFYHTKTLNDFKLMHLSWVYDLNFRSASRLFVERGYIKKILSYLPQTDEIFKAVEAVDKHLTERTAGKTA